MGARRRGFAIIAFICIASIAHAQGGASSLAAHPPRTKAEAGEWDVQVVKSAEAILASPEQWNHGGDSAGCKRDATTFTIQCALEKAVFEATGIQRPVSTVKLPSYPPATCALAAQGSQREGTCGELWDEMPVFTLERAKAVTSGAWRADIQPAEVWAGSMSAAENPVMTEARRLVDVLTANKKYPGRLVGYNSDSATTFADVQAFFRALEHRVRTHAAADLGEESDNVEIEVYADGTGVIRTYNGWFPVTGFRSLASGITFRFDTLDEVPPSALDKKVLQRAAAIISSDAVWNRQDNRKCPADERTWSIYCAEEKAMIEVTGGFHHRRPAMELVREIIDERTNGKSYHHRLMEYNNDSTTTLADVKSLFAEAIARVVAHENAPAPSFPNMPRATDRSRESPRDRFAELCLALPGAERVDGGDHSGFRVRGKVFAYFLDDHHGDGIVGCWCKTARGENRDWIAADPKRFYMPPYVGVRGWVGIRLDVRPVRWTQVGELVTDSYRLVAPKRLAADLRRRQ